MKKFNPKVSIIIPVYNGGAYLSEAIDSALQQTYNNIEVIVINDGSNDNGLTENVAKSYGNKIRYYKKENGGVASALNLGIKEMKGEYFSWLSHDDLYLTNKVSEQINMLSFLEDKKTVICCNVDIVNANKELIKRNKISENKMNCITGYLAFDQKTGLNGCTLLIHKDVFVKNGLFNEDLKVTQDYDMWYRIAKNNKFAIVNKNLVLSRQHDEQGSKTLINYVDKEVDKLHAKFINNLTSNELELYVNNNIDEYQNYYNQYKNMHCLKSAAETAVAYIKLLIEKNRKKDAYSFLNEKVFLNNEKNDINKNILNEKIKKKKRILIYNNIWVRGGIERVIKQVIPFLEKDYDIYFVTFNFSENKGYELPDYVNKIEISEKLDYMLSSVIYTLCRLLEIDLFIGNQNLNLNFLPIYKLLSEENIKTISCNHYNYMLPFQVDWLRSIAYYRNEYYKYADIVTWPTNFSNDIYNSLNKNGFYLPNPNTYEVIDKIPKKKKNHIVTVARYDDAFKRLDLVLLTFSKILKCIPNATLTIVGNYDLDMTLPSTNGKKIKDFLKDLNIPSNNLNFAGEQKNLDKFYKEAECFLFSSETEGFGMVINEAASFATPTIAFKIPGVEDLIENGNNGYLVELYNCDELAKKVVEYLSDDNLKNEFMNNALKKVKYFDMKNTEKRWQKLLKLAFNEEKYINESNENIRQIVNEFEKTILSFPYYANYSNNSYTVKSSLYSKIKYYFKKYGLIKTIKKIIQKIGGK